MTAKILKLLNIGVYVVVANDPDTDKFKECKVYFNLERANKERNAMAKAYGHNNVALFSRFILSKNNESY